MAALSGGQGVRLLGTHNLIYGQQNPSEHWLELMQLPHFSTDFLGVQSVGGVEDSGAR